MQGRIVSVHYAISCYLGGVVVLVRSRRESPGTANGDGDGSGSNNYTASYAVFLLLSIVKPRRAASYIVLVGLSRNDDW
jgi:hypothetical protein